VDALRHFAYAAGWKKFEPLWDWVIRMKRVTTMLPTLESILAGFGKHAAQTTDELPTLQPQPLVSRQSSLG
jgi:hypothetical protein